MKRRIFLISSSIFCGFVALLFSVVSCEWYLGFILSALPGGEYRPFGFMESLDCVFSIFAWVPENTITSWIFFVISFVVTFFAPLVGMVCLWHESGKLFEKYKKEISESKEISQNVSKSTDLDSMENSQEISKLKETSQEASKSTDLDGVENSQGENYAKKLLSKYKVVKLTSYQLRPKSGISPETVERALLEMKRKGEGKIGI